MSEETERLAREAETHRGRVDETLDRLKERFSVGQIVDELSGYVRDGQGADMVKNLNRQVRDNPLALGLVGAGVAWLLMGQGVRDEGRRLKGRYEDWREEDDLYDRDRLSGGGYPIADGRPHTVGEGPYAGSTAGSYSDSGRGPGYSARAKEAASSAASGISGAASSTASSVSGAASSAASGVAGAARSMGSSVSDAAQSAGSAISDAAGSASETVTHAMHDARDAAYGAGEAVYRGGASAGRRAAGYGRKARRSFLDTLQEEPLIVGAVALAIGAAVGAALPATRREDALFGEARDRLRDDAVDYGRDALSKAEHVASEAYKAGSEEAERKGLKPQGEGETLAEKASSVVGKAVDAAKDDARKEGLV
ncbi:DUF3618 domain-containing protein [Aureimonas populi]|uniref:DUF3618 domain-containing protein n=1 Tax=Aureimonas populi TaxID=1701758 RepID=A0ABW5CNG6_9HYPH|nr:DUF3618 domain-containing protein [Aureimonas populi]